MVKLKLKKTKTRKTMKHKKGGAAAAMHNNMSEVIGSGIPYHASNNYLPPGYQVVGQGSSKYVYKTPYVNQGYLYINSTPEQMLSREITKEIMLEEFGFALKIYDEGGGYFPRVFEAWTTPKKFVYMKEECYNYDVSTITTPTLYRHIEDVIRLMRDHSLFTFDLKVENMGTSIIDGHFVLFDFSPDNSFKLKKGCPQHIIQRYLTFSILILLLHCWNYSTISHLHLQQLAHDFIPASSLREFYLFDRGNYNLYTDPYIDHEFNNSVAPTISKRGAEPYQYIEIYGNVKKEGQSRENVQHEIHTKITELTARVV